MLNVATPETDLRTLKVISNVAN